MTWRELPLLVPLVGAPLLLWWAFKPRTEAKPAGKSPIAHRNRAREFGIFVREARDCKVLDNAALARRFLRPARKEARKP